MLKAKTIIRLLFKEPSIPTDVFNQPFKKAIAFFKSKLNIPTEKWDSLLKEQHLKSFSVAGAVKEDLIEDLRNSVDKIIEGGGTITDFRKDFDSIVEKHGWGYNGSKAWRTQIMLQTNVSVAHHRGHWQAMNSPAVKKARPYLRYLASSSRRRRPKHTTWVNTILPIDDPWWDTHYPPNGFGCKCGVVSMDKEDRDEFLQDEKDNKHPPRTTPKKDGTYTWEDSAGKKHEIPKHIDPGWDYNVGKMSSKDYIKGEGKTD